MEEEQSNSPPSKKRRNEIILSMIVIFVLTGAIGLGYWYFNSLNYETTEDAYVEGNTTRLSAQVPSFIRNYYCQAGDYVTKGQLLVDLDGQISEAQLHQAEAYLALTVRQAEGLFQKVQQAQLGLIISQIQNEEAGKIARHRTQIASSGALPGEEVERAQSNFEASSAQMKVAQSQNAEAHALTEGTTVSTHPSVKQATAQYIQAFINHKHTKVYAPFDGYIIQKLCNAGESVGPGTPLLSLIPSNQIWVTANFQETQLARIRPGQKALLYADMYGEKKLFEGEIDSLIPSTGSYLSLLPPQNATGNWVKVVQRIPVRIKIQDLQKSQNSYPLMVGLSMYVKVEIEETGQSLLPQFPRKENKIGTDVDTHYYQEAKLRAEGIIAENRSP